LLYGGLYERGYSVEGRIPFIPGVTIWQLYARTRKESEGPARYCGRQRPLNLSKFNNDREYKAKVIASSAG
jgi:hypothetical protein